MGLLDAWNSVEPDQKSAILQGLLAGGFGAMAGRGTALQAWGQGGLAGLQGYTGAQQQQLQQKRELMQNQLIQGQLAEAKRNEQIAALAPQFVTGGVKPATMDNRDVGQPGEAPIPVKSFDYGGYATALAGLDPMKAISLQAALAKPAAKFSTTPQYDQQGRAFLVDEAGNTKYLNGIKARDKNELVNGIWANPYTTETKGVAPQDPNKPMYYGPDGKMTANEMYQRYELSKAKAGASNVSVSMDKGFGDAFAKDAATALAASRDKAKTAANSLGTINQIESAINSGNVVTGPGAPIQTGMLQLGQALGVTGKDSEEKLANTRRLMQGAASLAVDGAQRLAGQGQITDKERELVNKMAGGDVDRMTIPEIQATLGTLKKINGQIISQHDASLGKVGPEFSKFSPFYRVDQPVFQASQPSPMGSSGGAPSVDVLVNKYRSK